MAATGIERRLVLPIPQGNITKPLAEFNGMTSGVPVDTFTGFGDVVRNIARPKIGDGHFTMTTGRSLPNGSTSYCAFNWRYDVLVQTGRNLVWQLQMSGSPILAISTLSGNWTAVDRVGGTQHRKTLGPIPWGRWAWFVCGVKLGDPGWVRVWWSPDGMPDTSKPPALDRPGKTWQGQTGHNTIGQYRDPNQGGVYTGLFSRFGRAATAERALELAA